jgi:RNA polymerase sigma-70 factor (ECF subfamily)
MPSREQISADRATAHASSDDAWAVRVSAGIASGSREALGALYEAKFAMLVDSLRRSTRRDESFILDCVQETMIRVATRLGPMTTHASLDAWLTRVALHAAIDRLRAERLRSVEPEPIRTASSEERSADFDAMAEITAMLARLPEGERSLLSLRFVRGLTLDQLGRHLGEAPKAIDSRIRRILGRLRGVRPQTEGEK